MRQNCMDKKEEKNMKIWISISVFGILVLVVLCSTSVLALEVNEVTIDANVLNSAPTVNVELTPDDAPAPGVQVINPDPRRIKRLQSLRM